MSVSVLYSPSVCLIHLLVESCSFGLPYVLFVFLLIVILVISHFGFEGGTMVLIASVPGHCLNFTSYYKHIFAIRPPFGLYQSSISFEK